MAGTCTYMMRWTLPWVASRGATPSAITIPAVRLATANHPSPRCSPLIGRRGRLHRRAPRARRPPPRSIVGGGLAAPSEPPQRVAPAKPALERARSGRDTTFGERQGRSCFQDSVEGQDAHGEADHIVGSKQPEPVYDSGHRLAPHPCPGRP